MCKFNLRLIVALLTFGIGVFTVYKFFLKTEETFEKIQKVEEINNIYNARLTAENTDTINGQETANDKEESINTSFLKCGGQNFNLVLISKYSERTRKNERTVRIAQDNTTIKTINSPEYAFIELAKKTKEGFEISVEYGSRYYYEKRFNFICKQGKFYFTKIKINTFDKANPETSWKVYSKVIKPNLQLEKFLIDDFMGN